MFLSEKSGNDEIEQRPQVGKIVLDRGSGQCETSFRFQRTYYLGLFASAVLDGLRLIEEDIIPFDLGQLLVAQKGPVGGDSEVLPQEGLCLRGRCRTSILE